MPLQGIVEATSFRYSIEKVTMPLTMPNGQPHPTEAVNLRVLHFWPEDGLEVRVTFSEEDFAEFERKVISSKLVLV